MKRLIEFPLEEGGSIVVEVDEPAPEGGVVRAARPGEVAAKAGQTFEATHWKESSPWPEPSSPSCVA